MIEAQESTLEDPRPSRLPLSLLAARSFLEPLLVFIIALVFYRSLYGEMPYHDVRRLVLQIERGKYVWDIGHILMQPVTLLWHKHLDFGGHAELSLKHINTFATALGLAVFHRLLLRLAVASWRRIAATALVMGSCSLITLAPTGHVTLLAFPFVNAALYFAVAWEQARSTAEAGSNRDLARSAILLAIASAFLAGCLATLPFAAMAVLAVSVRAGDRWAVGLFRALGFAALCGLTFAALAAFGYVAFSAQPVSLHGLAASIADKEGLRPDILPLADGVGRLVFGTANNLIAAPALGSVMPAWLAGYVPSLWPHAGSLVKQGTPWLCTLALLAAVYIASFKAAFRGAPCLVPLAFLCGAQAWSIYGDPRNPDQWFQLTVPTVVLFLTVFTNARIRALLAPWAIITLVVNLVLVALPPARYPVARYETQLRHMFSEDDLLVGFAADPDRQYLGVFTVPDVPKLNLDTLFQESRDEAEFFQRVENVIRRPLEVGGQVVLFGVLDRYNWDAPWPLLSDKGMTKEKLSGFFAQHYSIKPLGEIAKIKAWRLEPRQPLRYAPSTAK